MLSFIQFQALVSGMVLHTNIEQELVLFLLGASTNIILGFLAIFLFLFLFFLSSWILRIL